MENQKNKRPIINKDDNIKEISEKYVNEFKPEKDHIEKWKQVIEDLDKIKPYHPGWDHIKGHPGLDSKHQVKRYVDAIKILWIASHTKEIKQASDLVLHTIMQNAEKLNEYDRNYLQYRLKCVGVCIDVFNTSHDALDHSRLLSHSTVCSPDSIVDLNQENSSTSVDQKL